jgi:hypothetical protein
VFLMRRPSAAEISRFLDDSHRLPLSYSPAGIVRHPSGVGRFDEQVVTIGRGDGDFERARVALATWRHFDIGWVEAFPGQASIETGTVVAVLIRHLGFWSLNGARVSTALTGPAAGRGSDSRTERSRIMRRAARSCSRCVWTHRAVMSSTGFVPSPGRRLS